MRTPAQQEGIKLAETIRDCYKMGALSDFLLNVIRSKSYGTGHRDEDTAIERMKKVNLGIIRMLHPDKHREVPSSDRAIATEATAQYCNVYPEAKARFCASMGCSAPEEKPAPEWDGPPPPEDPVEDDFPTPPDYWGNWGRQWYGAYDGLTESQREHKQSVEKKWIFIPGYDILPPITTFRHKGWDYPSYTCGGSPRSTSRPCAQRR